MAPIPSLTAKWSRIQRSARRRAAARTGPSDFWHGRAVGVGELPQQREVELGEAVAAGGAAEGADHRAGAAHVGGARVVPRELQGEVGLHRDAQLRGAAGVVAPAAVGLLLAEDVA